MSKPKFESWIVEPMSELSRFMYIKRHMTLHLKSNAENVNWMLEASNCFVNGA